MSRLATALDGKTAVPTERQLGAYPGTKWKFEEVEDLFTTEEVEEYLLELLASGGGGGIAGIRVEDEGSSTVAVATALNFAGTGVTVTNAGSGEATVTIPGGGIAGIRVEDEGSSTVAVATALNFVGAGVTVTDAGSGEATVTIPSGSGGPAFDALTSGAVTAQVTRFGASAVVLSNPASGEYTFTVPAGVHLGAISLFGNNTVLNGSSEMLIRINNSANSRDRRVMVQLKDAQNGALVDQQVTATVHTESVSGNITLITIPGLNNFGATGYRVEIR